MGSPFSRAELLEYRGLFSQNILNGYGTTETFVNTYMRPFSPIEKCASTGQACIDDEVRLVKVVPDGHGEPDDLVKKDNHEIGEIIIKAPHKSTGCYVNNPEMTAKKVLQEFPLYRRYRHLGRGWLYNRAEPQGRHDHLLWREYLSRANRGCAERTSKGCGKRGYRRAGQIARPVRYSICGSSRQ